MWEKPVALTPIESMTTHDIVSPHDYSMEPFEKITDYEVGLLQTSFRKQSDLKVEYLTVSCVTSW